MYVRRALEPLLRRAASAFPVVVVTGPRQSGKTSTVRRLFGDTHTYLALDLPDVRALAASDPRLFLAGHPGPLILDEVQAVPGIFPYLREAVDAARGRRGRFILTGSQHFGLMADVTESLAGRAAILALPPFTLAERAGLGRACPVPITARRRRQPALPPAELAAAILLGGYPEMAVGRHPEPRLWHAGYVQTYLERDVRQIRAVGSLADFQRLMVLLAQNAGSLLSLSDVSRDLGVAVSTARDWISILEASYQIALLRPFYANVRKRLVKTPKVYFLDTGTLCYLRGLSTREQVLAGIEGGVLLENLVFCELMRHFWANGESPRVHFFRTSDGLEVDFLVEVGQSLWPVEVKLAATPSREMASGIERLHAVLGSRLLPGAVITAGDEVMPLTRNATVYPAAALLS